MNNKRNTIIQALYHGRINPDEVIVPSHPNYRAFTTQIAEQAEGWQEKLGETMFAELEAHLELRDVVNNMQVEATFSYGFKLGANLMLDVMDNNDA
ncbi:DUF6809 family protein [Paenibacillus yanchengensis]|uniref:DUF6809 family protein n=1 Tax=Paenibacillus yanchengensis TaxID=2035833 RepID=A0ABW4YPB3_9BACL